MIRLIGLAQRRIKGRGDDGVQCSRAVGKGHWAVFENKQIARQGDITNDARALVKGGFLGIFGYSRFFVAKTSKCGVYIEGKSGAFGMKMVACLGAALGD